MENDDLDQTLRELQTELARDLLERIKSGKANAADRNVARRLCADFGIDRSDWEQTQRDQTMLEISEDDLPVFDD